MTFVPFSRGLAAQQSDPRILDRAQHGIDDSALSRATRTVSAVLNAAGFDVFVVGGAVRDCMRSVRPEDFDLATNATSAQLLALFRDAQLSRTGYSVVRVRIFDEIVELTTLRPQSAVSTLSHPAAAWAGRLDEDSVQRDFTVNALYYDVFRGKVVDLHNGITDLHNKVLRPIGDPRARFSDDPLRMLRAIRLAHRLGFSIVPEARCVMRELAPLLRNCPAERLLAELVRHFNEGYAHACMRDVCAEKLHEYILPRLAQDLDPETGSPFLRLLVASLDDRGAGAARMSFGFVFAAVLWPQLRERLGHSAASSTPNDVATAGKEILSRQHACLGLAGLPGTEIQSIWATQPWFEQGARGMAHRLLTHPRFRAGFNFIQLRCQAGEVDRALGAWWSKFYAADANARLALCSDTSS